MEQNLEHTISLLASTPAALDGLLRDLPEEWTLRNEGDNTWNALEVVGHLVDCEYVNWLPRARMILEHGEARAFEPLNRMGFREMIEGKSLGQLLDEFAEVRGANLNELRGLNLRQEDFERRGHHPAFGAVTLSQLLAAWAGHDLTHLHQISRILAHQYREAVGPWSRFLGVLKCDGHSSAP